MQHSSLRLFSKALKATAILAVGCIGPALAPAFAAASALMPKPEALSETGQPFRSVTTGRSSGRLIAIRC